MIDLAALKTQLAMLGHNLPDSQIVSILQDMNIDFADLDDSKPGPTSAGAWQNGLQNDGRSYCRYNLR